MVERKAIFNKKIAEMVDEGTLYYYMTWLELPLTEALVYHMVDDLGIEKSRVAELLNVSLSRISHAYKNSRNKI